MKTCSCGGSSTFKQREHQRTITFFFSNWHLEQRLSVPAVFRSFGAQVLEFGEMTVAGLRIPLAAFAILDVLQMRRISKGSYHKIRICYDLLKNPGDSLKNEHFTWGQNLLGVGPSCTRPRMDSPERCQCIRARRLGWGTAGWWRQQNSLEFTWNSCLISVHWFQAWHEHPDLALFGMGSITRRIMK